MTTDHWNQYIHHYRCPDCGQEWTQDSNSAQRKPQYCPDTGCLNNWTAELWIMPHSTATMIQPEINPTQ